MDPMTALRIQILEDCVRLFDTKIKVLESRILELEEKLYDKERTPSINEGRKDNRQGTKASD